MNEALINTLKQLIAVYALTCTCLAEHPPMTILIGEVIKNNATVVASLPVSVPNITSSAGGTVAVSIEGGIPPYTYRLTSSCGRFGIIEDNQLDTSFPFAGNNLVAGS